MAKIVFPGWKSCCIRRKFGVKKHHANFQVAVHGLRDCLFLRVSFPPARTTLRPKPPPVRHWTKRWWKSDAPRTSGHRRRLHRLRRRQQPAAAATTPGQTPLPQPIQPPSNARPPVASEPESSPAAATTPAPATPPPAEKRLRMTRPSDTGINRNSTGGHTNNVRVKRCSRGGSRAPPR